MCGEDRQTGKVGDDKVWRGQSSGQEQAGYGKSCGRGEARQSAVRPVKLAGKARLGMRRHVVSVGQGQAGVESACQVGRRERARMGESCWVGVG